MTTNLTITIEKVARDVHEELLQCRGVRDHVLRVLWVNFNQMRDHSFVGFVSEEVLHQQQVVHLVQSVSPVLMRLMDI